MKAETKGVLSAVVTSVLWGFLAIAMKLGLNYVPALTLIWFRFAMAGGILLLYFLVFKASALSIVRAFPLLLALASICLGMNYLGFVKGLDYTSASTAQVLMQIGPILLAVSGIVFFKEKVSKMQFLGFFVAILGLILFYYNQLGNFVEEDYNAGFMWVLFATVSWTAYAIFQKKLLQKYPPQLLNLFLYIIPAIMLTPVAEVSYFEGLTIWQWGLMLFLGLNTLVAYGFLALAFKYTQAYKVSIIIILNPIITLTIMALLSRVDLQWIKGERLSLLAVFGASLLLLGAIITVLYSPRNKMKKIE